MQNTLIIQNVSPTKEPNLQGVALPQLVSGPEFATLFQMGQTKGLVQVPIGKGLDSTATPEQGESPQNPGAHLFEGSKDPVLFSEITPDPVLSEPAEKQFFPSEQHKNDPLGVVPTTYQSPVAVQVIPFDPEKTVISPPADPGGTIPDPERPTSQTAIPNTLISETKPVPRNVTPDAEIIPKESHPKSPENTGNAAPQPPGAADGIWAAQGARDVRATTQTPFNPGEPSLPRMNPPTLGVLDPVGPPEPRQAEVLAPQPARKPSEGTPAPSIASSMQSSSAEPALGLALAPAQTSPVVPPQAGQPTLPVPTPVPTLTPDPSPPLAQIGISAPGQAIAYAANPPAQQPTPTPTQPTEQIKYQQTPKGRPQPDAVVGRWQANPVSDPQLNPQDTRTVLATVPQPLPNAATQPAPQVDAPQIKPLVAEQQVVQIPNPGQDNEIRIGGEIRALTQSVGPAPTGPDQDTKPPQVAQQTTYLPRSFPQPPAAAPVVTDLPASQTPFVPERPLPGPVISEQQAPAPINLAGPPQPPLVPAKNSNRFLDQTAKSPATQPDQAPIVDAPTTSPKTPDPTVSGQEGGRNIRQDASTTLPAGQQIPTGNFEVRNPGPWTDGTDLDSGLSVALSSERSSTDSRGLPLPLARNEPAVARNIAAQIADIAPPTDKRPVDLTLNPEELGRVRLMFTHDKGHLMISVNADRPETLDLMRRHIETLAQELKGLGYGQVSFGFEQGGNQTSDQDPRHPDDTLRHDTALTENGQKDAPEDFRRTRLNSPMRNLAGNVDIRF